MNRIKSELSIAAVLRISLLILVLILNFGMAPAEAGQNNPLDSGQSQPHPETGTSPYCLPETPSAQHVSPLKANDDPQVSAPPALKKSSSSLSTSFGTAWPLENGYVVTNYHVVAGNNVLALQNIDGKQFKARPVLVDPANDLALLAVDDAYQLPPALTLCDIEAPSGASVFTLGFPLVDRLGYSPKFTNGHISSGTNFLCNNDRYLTTVNIQPGNSGGPLLNADGEVVGVVTAMLAVHDESTDAVNILPNQSSAVKIDHLRRLMDQLPDRGRPKHTRPEPGLPMQTLYNQIKDSVLVVIVRGDSG